MSKKPVKILKEKTLDKLFADYGRSEWAEALDVSPAAFDKWLQRGRVPIDKYAQAVYIRRAIDSGMLGKPLQEIMLTDTYKILSLEASQKGKAGLNPYYHHKVQNKSSCNDSGTLEEQAINLSSIDLNNLVDEIESRGWKVSLSRSE